MFLLVILASFFGLWIDGIEAGGVTLIGACCSSDGCTHLEEDRCTLGGGQYMGHLTQCGVDTCNGSCCCSDSCIYTTEALCLQEDCSWTRAGSVCGGSGSCVESGACCATPPGSEYPVCSSTDILTCYTQSGGHRWTEGVDCTVTAICPIKVEVFQDELPFLKPMKPVIGYPGCLDGKSSTTNDALYSISSSIVPHLFSSSFPNTVDFISMSGSTLPPLILTCESARIGITYVNSLPLGPHIGGDTSCVKDIITPNVQSIHNHGSPSRSKYDGVKDDIIPTASKFYGYNNPIGSRTFWMHDHGISVGRNLNFGSAGFYAVEPKRDLGLPKGDEDVFMILSDKLFYEEDGKVHLYYAPKFNTPGPFANDEYVGTVAVVNNKVTPYFNAKRTLYRFRLLNAANSRTWVLSLVVIRDDASYDYLSFYSIGGEQELTTTPLKNKVKYISIGNGERVQILVDFSGFSVGDEVFLVNSAKIPFPNGDDNINNSPVSPVMKIVITDGDGPAGAQVPASIPRFNPAFSVPKDCPSDRSFLLYQDTLANTDCADNIWLLKGFHSYNKPQAGFYSFTNDKSSAFENNLSFESNTVTKISFWNPTPIAHPMHIHGIEFKVVQAKTISMNDSSCYECMTLGPSDWVPEPHEQVLKDTIKIPPETMIELAVRFTAEPGFYLIHCHILEHEDNKMMIHFHIKPKSPSVASKYYFMDGAVCGNNICEAANGENCHSCPSDCMQGSDYCCGYDTPAFLTKSDRVITSRIRQEIPSDHSWYIGCTNLCKAQKLPYLYTTFCTNEYIISYCGDSWCERGEDSTNCPHDCNKAKLVTFSF